MVACQGTLKAFDPSKGTPLWNCATDITWYMVPSAVSHAGIVYSLGGRSGVAGLAVKAGGSGDVTSSHRLWTSLKGSNVTSPIYHEGHLYFMHENRGVALCLRADTGEVVYEERLATNDLRDGSVFNAAPVPDKVNSRLLIRSDKVLYAIGTEQ